MIGRTASLALVLLAGCTLGTWDDGRSYEGSRYDDGYTVDYGETDTSPGYYGGGTDSVIPVTDVFMAGDLGDARGFGETPYEVSAYRYDDGYGAFDTLRFDAIDSSSGMWVMAQVNIQGGLDHEAFTPGASLELGTPSLPDVSGSGLGCSGPSVGNFTFDEPPSQIHVEVTSGSAPGLRRFDFRLSFGAQVVDVSFEAGPVVETDPGIPAGEGIAAATLSGSVGGVAVDGEATFVSELALDGQSAILVEHEQADRSVVRLRIDLAGEAGGYGAVQVRASTTPFDVDPSYPITAVEADAYLSGSASARVLQVFATFPSGESLSTILYYR